MLHRSTTTTTVPTKVWRRRRSSAAWCAAAAFVVAASIGLLSSASHAQTEIDSFALAPTGTDPSQPGSRPYLSYTAAPGTELHDSVTLWNYGNSQLTFHVYSPDAFNNADGSFGLQKGPDHAKDAGAWVTLETSSVTMRPGTKTDIAFTLEVPGDASPGDHTAAIIASSQTDATNAEGKNITLDRRTGSRLYVRVDGAANPQLAVESMSTVYHASANPLDGDVDVTYTVRNVGNIRLGAHQTVSVSDVFGEVASHEPCPVNGTEKKLADAHDQQCITDIPELLPNSAVTFTQHFSGVAATLRVSGELSLAPVAGPATAVDAKDLATVDASAGAWAIPWLLVLLLALVAAVIWVVRRRRAASSGGSLPGGGIGAVPPAAPVPNGHVAEPVGSSMLHATSIDTGGIGTGWDGPPT